MPGSRCGGTLSGMANETPSARRYLLHHRHRAEDCGVAFASFKGLPSPLRHSDALASCRSGEHAIWWVVDAASREEALALLPFFVAERSTAVEVTQVRVP
jgi:hypothetical protein